MNASEKPNTTAEKEKQPQKKRQRSPGYPGIPIDDAITRIGQVYQQDRRAFTTYDAILEHLGYSAKNRSGTSGRAISALRQYGLLDEQDNNFRVSELGFRILHLPEGSEEQRQLIKTAALKPQIFRKLLTQYRGEVPSDAALRSHLVLREGFNPDSVDQFIRVFRRTIEIANPSAEDYSTGEELDVADGQQRESPMLNQQEYSTAQEARRAGYAKTIEAAASKREDYERSILSGGNSKEFRFPLSFQRNVNAVVTIHGENLKKRDLEILKKKVGDLIDAWEDEEEFAGGE